ncbi:hypothetical protein SAMN04488038_11384 [Solimonas aquatica]|uniref:Uncharacterized protein n=1 Tax=Solimonas aquatica TaxID=489703 RepID=A0A1H9KF96_9GAMM|nr:hypothetical protein [Solimonas aquatica]SEQ97791.1 hypothetical protein SAMN04488038_11384 [Solimonas aquatica]
MSWRKISVGICGALLLGSAAAQAEPAVLSGEALAACAQAALQLREQSPRLLQSSEQLEAERARINQRSAELKAQAAATPRDDLRAQLELRERRNAHNAQARDFNLRMDALKHDIDALNVVKDDYTQHCAQQSYRRSELAQLPPAAQEAMRMGLQDLQVPYIDSAAPSPAAPALSAPAPAPAPAPH